MEENSAKLLAEEGAGEDSDDSTKDIDLWKHCLASKQKLTDKLGAQVRKIIEIQILETTF